MLWTLDKMQYITDVISPDTETAFFVLKLFFDYLNFKRTSVPFLVIPYDTLFRRSKLIFFTLNLLLSKLDASQFMRLKYCNVRNCIMLFVPYCINFHTATLLPCVCYPKIEDTCIRSIPHESCRRNRAQAEEEQRYLKLFLNVDLKANFYFRYWLNTVVARNGQ